MVADGGDPHASVASAGQPGTGVTRGASYTDGVRVLGIDYGARRIGLALSDATGTLASPWRLLERPPSEAQTLGLVSEIVEQLQDAPTMAWARSWSDGRAASTARRRTRRRQSRRSPAPSKHARACGSSCRTSGCRATRPTSVWPPRGERDWRARKKQDRCGGGRHHPAGLPGLRAADETNRQAPPCSLSSLLLVVAGVAAVARVLTRARGRSRLQAVRAVRRHSPGHRRGSHRRPAGGGGRGSRSH